MLQKRERDWNRNAYHPDYIKKKQKQIEIYNKIIFFWGAQSDARYTSNK